MLTENDICLSGLKNYYTGENGSINDARFANTPPPPEMVELCREFIREKMEAKHLRGRYSYHLKHEVERWCGKYIANGAFIMAALLEGIIQEPTGICSPNTWIFARKKYRGQVEPRGEA